MNPFEQYAAQRADDLSAADDVLRPVVTEALSHYPIPDWYDPILNEAEALFATTYEAEGGDPGHFDLALTEFNETAGSFLEKTTPQGVQNSVDEDQVERITTWMSTFTANSAVASAADPDDKMVWTSMRDDGVRDTHRTADGQVRTVGQTFDVGGAALRFPGDPTGPLSEVLGCRCLLLREGGTTMARQFAVTEEIDALPVEDMPDGDTPEFAYENPRWHGVLAPEGAPSGDGRSFAADSITTRDLPIPLRWVKEDRGMHDGAVVVGNITSVWRDGGLIKAEGDFRTDSEQANEVVGMVATDMLRGVSVDLDDIAFELDDEANDMGEQSVTITKGRISAATLVDIPAFAEAFIALGPWEESDLATAAIIASCGCSVLNDEYAENPFPPKGKKDAPAEKPTDEEPAEPEFGEGDAVKFDGPDGTELTGVVTSVEPPLATVAVDGGGDLEVPLVDLKHNDPPEDKDEPAPGAPPKFAAGTKDGPGWLTNPKDTQRLRTYWTKGEGAAKIAWGTPGDFNRCRTQLGKYVDPLFLAGTCANMHKEALGVWPGREGGGVAGDGEAFTLVSSAEKTLPHSWFVDPHLDGPTPIYVGEDGRVYGHLALWDSCHIGVQGVCTTPPQSRTNYAHFTTGAVLTDQGQVAVGQITMDTGHASLNADARSTTAHYDHTGTAVVDVAVGDDEFGIWVAGALRDDLAPAKIRALRAGALSGDWRRIGGNLELVAALAVNVPGFPIPRTGLAASAGEQVALVASGVVHSEDVEIPDLVAAVRAAMLQIDTERARSEKVAAARATLRAARVQRARAALRH